MKRLLLRACTAFGLVAWTVLALAAPAQPRIDPLRPKSDEGIVLLQLAHNFPVGTSALGLVSPIQVRRVGGDEKKIVIAADTTGMVSSSHYLGALPEGRYRLYDFLPSIGCWVCKHPEMPPNAAMPEFVVRRGEVAYLGPILLSITTNAFIPGRQREIRWGWDETPDLVSGQRMFAALQPALASMKVHSGWAESRQPGHDLRWRESIRAVSQGMVMSGRYGRDGFYFGAQNGVVKRWRPGSSIEMLDTGGRFFLISVLETPGGWLLASGEAGALLASSDGGRTWTERGADLPFGVVSNLVSLDDRNAIAFTVNTPESVLLYRGSADSRDFDKIGEFDLKFSFWTGAPGVQPQLFRRERSLVLTLPSKKFVVVDLDTGLAELRTPPGSISNFKLNPDGTLWCSCAKTIAFSPYVSRDLGKTWESSDISRFMLLPEMFDAQKGFSYQGAIFSPDKTGVATTSDGGKSWSLKHEPDISRSWWIPAYSADGSVMLLHSVQLFSGSAMTFSKYSLDGGETWKVAPRQMVWAYGDSPD